MNVGGAFAGAVIMTVLGILFLLRWLIIIAAVLSWVSPDPRNPLVRFIYRTTEPILRPFRRILPPRRTGGIDLSPILAILLIVFLEYFLKGLFPTVRFS